MVSKALAVRSFYNGSVRRSGFDGADLSYGSLKRGSWPLGAATGMSVYLVNAETSRTWH